MTIGHSNKTTYFMKNKPTRKMRIAVYNLQCTVCYCM